MPFMPGELTAVETAVLLLTPLLGLVAWLLLNYLRKRSRLHATVGILRYLPVKSVPGRGTGRLVPATQDAAAGTKAPSVEEASVEILKRRVEVMDRLGRLMVEARDSSDVRQQIVLAFVEGLNCRRGSLWELTKAGSYFLATSEVRPPEGAGASVVGSQMGLKGEPLLERLASRAVPMLIDEGDPEVIGALVGDPDLGSYDRHSVMLVPLLHFNRVIGLLALDDPIGRGSFQREDVEVARSAATYSALVLENLRVRIADQERGGRMTALARLAATLTTRHDLDEVLPEIVHQGRALVHSATCALLLVEDDGSLRLAAQVGLDEEQGEIRLPLSEPAVAAFIQRDAPLIVEDIDRDRPELRALAVRPDIKSVQVFPLRVATTVIGVLALGYMHAHWPDRAEINLAETLASVAAGAIHNARAFELEIEQRDLLRTVAEISRRVSGILDAKWMLLEVCNLLGRELEHDYVHAFLVKENGTQLVYAAGTGEIGHILAEREIRLPVDDSSVLGQAVKAASIRREGAALGSTFRVSEVGLDDPVSELALPIVAHNHVIGVLDVQSKNRDAFGPEDEKLLKIVADQVSVALDNARHHAEVQAQARLDSLTQVLNHGTFVSTVHMLVDRCREDETPLSLIMLDVDMFKEYNDRFGHVAGDAALKTTVQAIRANIKSRDAVGRWGGEEFGIALIGADRQQALGVAERISQTLNSLVPVDRLGREMPSPSVSQGVATLGVDAYDADELVDVADQALYRAKDAGRDQVRAAGEH